MGCTESLPKGKLPIRTSRIRVKKNITNKYRIEPKILGTGNFGKVFLGQSIKDPNFKVAIKVVKKELIKNYEFEIFQEIE